MRVVRPVLASILGVRRLCPDCVWVGISWILFVNFPCRLLFNSCNYTPVNICPLPWNNGLYGTIFCFCLCDNCALLFNNYACTRSLAGDGGRGDARERYGEPHRRRHPFFDSIGGWGSRGVLLRGGHGTIWQGYPSKIKSRYGALYCPVCGFSSVCLLWCAWSLLPQLRLLPIG